MQKRFKNLQKLESISYAASYQEPLQVLLADSVAKETEKWGVKNMKILEIGTGQGLTTGKVLNLTKEAMIVSADNDLGMVEQAKKNLFKDIENGNLDVRSEDALEFLRSFPDNFTPIIFSGFTIHNFKNAYRFNVLSEVYRVLRIGGKFMTADKIMPNNKDIFEEEVKRQDEEFKKIPDKTERKKWRKHYEEDMAPDTIMREGELIKILKEMGFADIVVSKRQHLGAFLVAKK